MNIKKGSDSGWYFIVLGVLFILTGIFMLVFDIVKVGNHAITQQPGTIGGTIIIFFGAISVYVGYHSISPFSKFREFFEGSSKINKTSKKKMKPKSN